MQNTGNVTTTYSADMSFNDPGLGLQAQLIVWTAHVTGTSRDCAYALIADNQILAAKNLTNEELGTIKLPTVDNPFAGPVSFVARPGQVVYATLRVFGDKAKLDTISAADFVAATGLGVSAHACNDPENIDPAIDCLTVGFEKILVDNAGPSFVGLKTGDTIPDTPIEADRIGGACIDLVGGMNPLVAATDTSGVKNLFCSLVATGEQICSAGEPGLSIPVMSDPTDPATAAQVLCTAIDNKDNEATVQIGIAVADTTAPTISGTPIEYVSADPDTGTAVLALEYGLTATDDPLVDPYPVLSCTASGATLTTPAITGEAVGPGIYTVSCFATDVYSNLSLEFIYPLEIDDITPPTLSGVPADIAGVEATGPDGARVTYDAPTASDTAGGTTVSCSPASGSTFSLGTTTVICTATDDGDNSATAAFDVEIVDTTPPTIETPDKDVLVAVGTSGFGTLDFEAQVTATDIADLNPVVDCIATSGAGAGARSGDPLAVGETEVSCTATDASDNEASASYTVRVEFGSSFGIDFSKGGVKSGSTAPSTFGWLDESGNRIDSSDANPVVTAKICATGEIVLNPGQFPGNSDLRWDATMLEWKFNWQTVFEDGTPIPGSLYCVQVISLKTGQLIPDDGSDGTTIRVRD